MQSLKNCNETTKGMYRAQLFFYILLYELYKQSFTYRNSVSGQMSVLQLSLISILAKCLRQHYPKITRLPLVSLDPISCFLKLAWPRNLGKKFDMEPSFFLFFFLKCPFCLYIQNRLLRMYLKSKILKS